jgi:hypothetical protein
VWLEDKLSPLAPPRTPPRPHFEFIQTPWGKSALALQQKVESLGFGRVMCACHQVKVYKIIVLVPSTHYTGRALLLYSLLLLLLSPHHLHLEHLIHLVGLLTLLVDERMQRLHIALQHHHFALAKVSRVRGRFLRRHTAMKV